MFTKKQSYIAGVLLIAAISATAVLSSDKATPETTAAPTKQGAARVVSAAPAKMISLQRLLFLDAEIVSMSSPLVAAEVSGRIQKVLVLPGDVVKKGQTLVEIDPGDLLLSSADVKAQLEQMRTTLAEKERLLKTNEELLLKEYVSRSTVEAGRADVAGAKQMLAASESKFSQAQRNVAKTAVVAPFDATAVSVSAVQGGFARVGDPLVTLWSPSSSYIRVKVPQAHMGAVSVGQSLTLSNNSGSWESTIESVRSDIEVASRSFEIRASVPQALASSTGSTFGAHLSLSSPERVVVPVLAVQLDAKNAFVYVVKDGKAVKTKVTTGAQSMEKVELLSGVVEGDVVVTEGASFVREGQTVSFDSKGADQ